MMKTFTKSKAGFSLIEIMITVGIIGLLAAIAIPNMLQSRNTAQAATCVDQLRQIEQATQEWALDFRRGSSQTLEYSDIKPYLKGAVKCPAGGTTFSDSYQITTVGARPLCKRVTGGEHPHVLPDSSSPPVAMHQIAVGVADQQAQ